ncbi:MAG: HAMP domain-containing histidine kinase, partial [Tannerellaceae bacterium]|nr:HAMP domain-containing histidine kinase [Tannerellaceae bacterium]
PLITVNYHRYDSLLASELKAKNMDTRYQLFLVRDSIGKRTIVQSLGKKHPVPASPERKEESVYYDYPSMLNKHADSCYYRLYINTPARIVLHQMTGILASSFLLLVIIGAAFVYLLRTIMRQKTEKELKEDFTNNMTHELKTPVSVSYAAVDSLLHFSETIDDRQRKYLTIVQEQLTRLTGLVEQILTLSVENRSTFRLRLEPVALSAFINRLIEQYKVNANQSVRFTVNIPDGITVTADKIHLHNIFNNLIDNAIKYSDRETTDISLKAEVDKGIHISVSDNGAGISPAHQARIFDRFYRIPDGNRHNVKGHGLGLYYVKDMMAKHEGGVSVESTPGRGSTFHLTFKI